MEGCLTAIHLQVVISWHELQTQPSNAKDDRSHSEIVDSVPFCFLFKSHKLLLQNSTQPDSVWPSKQFLYQNCSVLKWQQTELTRYLSNPIFYSTNTQANLRHWRVLSKEWDHQVWGQSNFVWVTNRRLEDNRFSATKSRQISCSPFSLLHTLRCVFCTL